MPVNMLRVRPDDQSRQNRIDGFSPKGDTRQVVSGPIVAEEEENVSHHIEEPEEHVEGHEG